MAGLLSCVSFNQARKLLTMTSVTHLLQMSWAVHQNKISKYNTIYSNNTITILGIFTVEK